MHNAEKVHVVKFFSENAMVFISSKSLTGVGRFAGGMESLPGGEFPEQFPPPDHLVLPRPSSPEFTFGDAPPPLHPEGLVW